MISNTAVLLKKYSHGIGKVVPFPLYAPHTCILDLSNKNTDLEQAGVSDTATFANYVFSKIKSAGASAAIGGYNEDRMIYHRSNHFMGEEPRTIHLGIDIWTEASTQVFAPLSGNVHSFHDNAGFGDYGPTIILEHRLENTVFYTLYGHLSRASLTGLYKGQIFEQGATLGQIGPYPENGDWPPHLHFQIITDMLGMEGDFPGVASVSKRDFYLSICPDPMLILGRNG